MKRKFLHIRNKEIAPLSHTFRFTHISKWESMQIQERESRSRNSYSQLFSVFFRHVISSLGIQKKKKKDLFNIHRICTYIKICTQRILTGTIRRILTDVPFCVDQKKKYGKMACAVYQKVFLKKTPQNICTAIIFFLFFCRFFSPFYVEILLKPQSSHSDSHDKYKIVENNKTLLRLQLNSSRPKKNIQKSVRKMRKNEFFSTPISAGKHLDFRFTHTHSSYRTSVLGLPQEEENVAF